jgi:phage-related minor tail protein
MYQHRLEDNTATKENILLREREQNDATTKAQIESQERSEQLLKKFLDVDRKIDLLQDTIERYFIIPSLKYISVCLVVSFLFYEMLLFDTHFFEHNSGLEKAQQQRMLCCYQRDKRRMQLSKHLLKLEREMKSY